MTVNQLQKYEWMLRIPKCNLQNGVELLKRIPDPQPEDESMLLNAMQLMEEAVWSIEQWAERNGIVIKESMKT